MSNRALQGLKPRQLSVEAVLMHEDSLLRQGVGPAACESDDSAIRQLLDTEFDRRPGVVDEYPVLMSAINRPRRWIARESGAVVAHAAWRPLQLITPSIEIRAAGIGLVTTHRGWRGRGLASRLVGSCLDAARAEGAEVVLLFGAPRSLYARHGFVPAGRERVIRADAQLGREMKLLDPRAGRAEDAKALHRLLAQHALRVERSVDEFAALLQIPDTRVWVHDRDGEPIAYCIEGKGRDLVGVIHEWAGDPGSVAALIHAIAGEADGVTWVLSPDSARPPVDGECGVGPLAQIAILQPERFDSGDPVEVFGSATRFAQVPIYIWGLDSV